VGVASQPLLPTAAALPGHNSSLQLRMKRGASDTRSRPPAAVEASRQRLDFAAARARRFEQLRGRPLAAVHQGLAEHRTDAARLEHFTQHLGVAHRAHVVDAGDPPGDELGEPEPCRGGDRGGGVRRLERPDALAQPGEEVALLGKPAEQGLAEMEVSVDEAGNDQRPGGVDLQVGPGPRERRRDPRAERRDHPVARQQIAAQHGARVVHAQRGAGMNRKAPIRPMPSSVAPASMPVDRAPPGGTGRRDAQPGGTGGGGCQGSCARVGGRR
jgi:hypothetical protein